MRSSAIPYLLLISIIFLTSCGTQNKVPGNYLESISDTIGKDAVKFREYRIQKNDLLSIQVYSASVDPRADIPYNLPNQGEMSGAGTTINGFLVDEKGNIDYPHIGTIQVEGLSKAQLTDVIKSRLTADSALINPVVIIRLLNFRVTVLGEVARAGSFSLPTEKVTILEAIGLAGDIPLSGKKNNIRVMREVNGTREIGTIDLTSDNFFDSPYYNLQQNDVVIVSPTKLRAKQADQVTSQRISLALSIITSIALIYNVFR